MTRNALDSGFRPQPTDETEGCGRMTRNALDSGFRPQPTDETEGAVG